jgi:uncharacterized membrane protein
MLLRRGLFLVVVSLGVLFAGTPAMAEFSVCNNSQKTAYVASGHWNNYSYVTQGWSIVQPGTCTITYPGDLQWQWYFVFARTNEDETGNYDVWGGDEPLCIHWPNGFTIVGNEGCDTGFIKVDTGLSKTFTFTLE